MNLKVIVFAIFAAVVVGGVGFYWHSTRPVSVPPTSESPTETQPLTQPTDDPDWNLYVNKRYSFSIEYPAKWQVKKEETLSKSGDPEYLLREMVVIQNPSGDAFAEGVITIKIRESKNEGLVSWARQNRALIPLTSGKELPESTNGMIDGLPAIVIYAESVQAPDTVAVVLKKGDFIYQIEHFRPWTERPNWGLFRHVAETFEFQDTEEGVDLLPRLSTIQPQQVSYPKTGLEGFVWVLSSFGDRDSQQLIPEGVKITAKFYEVSFRPQIKVFGAVGCNHYHTIFDIKTDKIETDAMGRTANSCQPEEVIPLEKKYLDILIDVNSYKIKGNRLEMFSSSGASVLIFGAQQEL